MSHTPQILVIGLVAILIVAACTRGGEPVRPVRTMPQTEPTATGQSESCGVFYSVRLANQRRKPTTAYHDPTTSQAELDAQARAE